MKNFFFFFITTIVFVMISFSLSSAQNIEKVVDKFGKLPLTTENVAKAIVELEIRFPKYVFSQSVKESGYNSDKTGYKSRLALDGNNLFGMRRAKKRKTFALKEECFGYAKYSHWIFSIIDYKLWEDCVELKKNESFKQYLTRRHYVHNTTEYIKSLNAYKIPENILSILIRKNLNNTTLQNG